MTNNYPLISIQILSWNKAEETLKAIQSALDQTYPNTEVVVVDNGSDDNSVARIRQRFPQVTLVELDRNYGCPEGRNRGVPYCKGEFIFYMDNDALLHRKAVEQAWKSIRQDERIGVVGGSVYPFTDYKKANVNCALPNGDHRYVTSRFHGGVCLHRKTMYDTTGFYPGHYFYGGEESYLTMRMLSQEYYVLKDESVILWHIPSKISENNVEDLVNRQTNGLTNRLTFWPAEFAFIYTLKSLIRHPYQAIRYRVFGKWLTRWPRAITRKATYAIKTRRPLSRSDIRLYYGLSTDTHHSVKQIKQAQVSYMRCLWHELLQG